MNRTTINSNNALKYAAFGQVQPLNQFALAYDEVSDLTTPHLPQNDGYLLGVDDGLTTVMLAIKIADSTVTEWTITGFTAIDHESCTSFMIGPCAYFVSGDTGNNAGGPNTRGAGIDFQLARCVEPIITGSNGTIPASNVEIINGAYPNANLPANRDVEGIFADPQGNIYLATKRVSPVKLYMIPYMTTYSGIITATYLGDLTNDPVFNVISTTPTGNNGYVTGAAMSRDGREIYLSNYSSIYCWRRQPNESVIQCLQRKYDYYDSEQTNYSGRYQWGPRGQCQREAFAISRNGNIFYQTTEYYAAQSYGTAGASLTPYPFLWKSNRVYGNPQKVVLQNGLSGYNNCVTAAIDSATPNTPMSGSATPNEMKCDYNFSVYPTINADSSGLVMWSLTSIPSNAVVIDAMVDLWISNEGRGIEIFKALRSWGPADNYNSLNGGMQLNNIDCSTTVSAEIGSLSAQANNIDTIGSGPLRFTLPVSDIQNWVSGVSANYGYVLKGNRDDTTGDGMRFYNSSYSVLSARPMLTVIYYVP